MAAWSWWRRGVVAAWLSSRSGSGRAWLSSHGERCAHRRHSGPVPSPPYHDGIHFVMAVCMVLILQNTLSFQASQKQNNLSLYTRYNPGEEQTPSWDREMRISNQHGPGPGSTRARALPSGLPPKPELGPFSGPVEIVSPGPSLLEPESGLGLGSGLRPKPANH